MFDKKQIESQVKTSTHGYAHNLTMRLAISGTIGNVSNEIGNYAWHQVLDGLIQPIIVNTNSNQIRIKTRHM